MSGESFILPLEPPGGLDLRFCEVMDAAPVMIWVSREDKLCSWFNKPWLAFTGRTMAQELGNGWTQGVHPEDYDRCLQTFVSHFDARKEFRMQYRLRHQDGEYRWIDDIGIPRYAHDRTFLGYIGSCTDINASRVAEDRLRQFEILVQGIKHYAIYLIDTEGNVVSWNKGAEHIKGYAAGEILGQNFSRFYTTADQDAGLPKRVLRRAANDGKFEGEGWRVRKDGSQFWANVLVVPSTIRVGSSSVLPK